MTPCHESVAMATWTPQTPQPLVCADASKGGSLVVYINLSLSLSPPSLPLSLPLPSLLPSLPPPSLPLSLSLSPSLPPSSGARESAFSYDDELLAEIVGGTKKGSKSRSGGLPASIATSQTSNHGYQELNFTPDVITQY